MCQKAYHEIDTDSDYAMEKVQIGHYDSAIPFCVRLYNISDEHGTVYLKQLIITKQQTKSI
jgi:hypothetical protein